MKQLFFLFLIISIFSCSNDVSNDNKNDNSKVSVTNKKSGPTIIQNKSVVVAKLISKEIKDEQNFSLIVKVLKVEDNSNYESIVVAGDEYTLKPGFYYDENNELSDNDRNRRLKELTTLNPGDEFKAEISLEHLKGWIISKVINQ